jgi:hypothetical protein
VALLPFLKIREFQFNTLSLQVAAVAEVDITVAAVAPEVLEIVRSVN